MKAEHVVRLLGCVLAAAAVALSGCENNDSDESDDQVAQAAAAATNATEQTHFPDGLHPDSEGDRIIAGTFSKHIEAAPAGIGANDPNTVVALGDSITSGGYPGPLAGMTGKNVIDEGAGGEKSVGGASRAAGVLSQYKPAYLLILYGANDVINGIPHAETMANLQAIITAARNNQTIPVIGTLTPMSGHYEDYNASAHELSGMIRDLAGSTGTGLADLESKF